MEDWERSYYTKTGIVKRISAYTGLNLLEVLRLPYSFFMLLNKESWIDSYMSQAESRDTLKNLWRLQNREADTKAIESYRKRKGG